LQTPHYQAFYAFDSITTYGYLLVIDNVTPFQGGGTFQVSSDNQLLAELNAVGRMTIARLVEIASVKH